MNQQRGGNILSYLVGIFLPIPSKLKADDQQWKFPIGIPMFLGILQIFLLTQIYYYETPKGCLLKRDADQCNKILGKIYNSNDRIKQEKESIIKILNENVLDY